MLEWTTLGEILVLSEGSIKTGPFGTVLKANEYAESGVPVISVGEIGHGALRIHARTPRVDSNVLDRLPEYVLREGDVVFARKGAVERSAWVSADQDGYFLGSDGIRARFGSGVSARFLAFQLRGGVARDWLRQHAAGTTMPSLNQRILERLPLILPDYRNQCRITEVLGALDDKITANQSISRTSFELAEARYVQIAQSAGEPTALGKILSLEYGKPLAATSRHDGGVPVYGSGGVVGLHNEALVNRPGVVVGRKGTAGSVHWVHGPHFPIDTTFSVAAVDGFPITCCYFALKRAGLEAMNGDSAVPGLNRHQAHAVAVTVPRADRREAFDGFTKALFTAAAARDDASRVLAELRDLLLPELMSGRIRVKDAERAVGEVM